jgi:hypothetical protein
MSYAALLPPVGTKASKWTFWGTRRVEAIIKAGEAGLL